MQKAFNSLADDIKGTFPWTWSLNVLEEFFWFPLGRGPSTLLHHSGFTFSLCHLVFIFPLRLPLTRCLSFSLVLCFKKLIITLLFLSEINSPKKLAVCFSWNLINLQFSKLISTYSRQMFLPLRCHFATASSCLFLPSTSSRSASVVTLFCFTWHN